MKRRITTLACILGLCLLPGVVAWAGDGQIDIAEIPCTISSSGSYIVVRDLATTQTETNGITIDADNVTLDLNGHALIGPGKAAGTTGDGIYVSSPAKYNIAIRNGTVRDWRGDGVGAGDANNSQFEVLRCYNNGSDGMRAGIGSTVSGNTCRSNGDNGIYTDIGSTVSGNSCPYNGGSGIFAGPGNTVSGNTCRSNGGDGIYTVSGSTVSGNTCHDNGGDGIFLQYGCTVSGNTCNNNGADGIFANQIGCTISGNTCRLNTGDGIQVPGDCRVVDNTCNANGNNGDGAGILATGSSNRISNNHCTNNDRGLDLDGANNIVSGNTLIGNTTPVDAVADNQLDILISELPYTISQPGMYRLTGDLTLVTQDTDGITIDADNATLDLNGHALIGPGKATGTSGHGILVNGTLNNITIRNGTVRDWRSWGIQAINSYNSRFETLLCYNNGWVGLSAGSACTVSGNVCSQNANAGIYAQDKGCTIIGNTCRENGFIGLYAYGAGNTVSGNTCSSNVSNGIYAGAGSTVASNSCYDNGSDGLYAATGSTISGNTCQNNTGDGIEATSSLVAENCCVGNGTNFNLTTCTAVNNHP